MALTFRPPANIVMVGAGYVGLVTGACLAQKGVRVQLVEKDPERLKSLKSGHAPFYEPGLSDLLLALKKETPENLTFAGSIREALDHNAPDAIFLAVGTPAKTSGEADLSQIFEACEVLAICARQNALVVVKSTVPAGTCAKVRKFLRNKRPDLQWEVASNPEFLREGQAIEDFRQPDRIIIGLDQTSGNKLPRRLFDQLYGDVPADRRLYMSLESAELAKYAANAFLALRLAFINEMADLCENSRADIEELALGIGLDPRIGPLFLKAGPGFGGSCFPKDIAALAHAARERHAPVRLVEATMELNQKRKEMLADKIAAFCGGTVKGKTIGVLGVTFKPETDDVREAPSLPILTKLLKQGANLRVYDPAGMENAAKAFAPASFARAETAEEAVSGADLVILMTDWPEFRALSARRLAQLMRGRKVVDLRNFWKREEMEQAGLQWLGIGKGRI